MARTWSTTTVKNLDSVVAEINAMNAGIKAEFIQSTAATSASACVISTATLSPFSTARAPSTPSPARGASTRLGLPVVQGNPILGATNNARRLELGTQYEAYKVEITNLITNNVVQAGRNLLQGQSMSVILNEFAANPIAINGVNTTVAGNLA